MICSGECRYAIRLLSWLASHGEDTPVTVQTIAEKSGVPKPFSAKILHRLARAGFVNSGRGRRGGFSLAVDPHTLSLYDIYALIDGEASLHECAVGLQRCSDQMPCPLHDQFKPIRQRIINYLHETTLEQMAQALERKLALVRQGAANEAEAIPEAAAVAARTPVVEAGDTQEDLAPRAKPPARTRKEE